MTEEIEEPSPESLLNEVRDCASFLRFVHALADQAERAEEMTRQDPKWGYGAPLGWQNQSVSSFLGGAIVHLDAEDAEPSWKTFAEFLYCGKIIE